MSNDQPGRRPPAKSGGGGAPMGSTISIIIAVVAVVVGFVILKNINDDSGGGGGAGAETPDSTGTDSSTVIDPTSTTSTTLAQIPVTLAPDLTQTVVVANASGVGGAAGQMSTALTGVGFTMGTPTNATGVEARLDISKVYYLGGGEGTAASVAAQFGGIQSVAMPTAVPVEGETAGLGGATVLLMLGKDFGGKPLPALSADASLPATPLDLATTTTIAG